MDPSEDFVHDANLSFQTINVHIEKPTTVSASASAIGIEKSDSEFFKIHPTTGKTPAKILNINVSAQPPTIHHGVSHLFILVFVRKNY